MKIKELKKAINEYEELKKTNDILNHALKRNVWIGVFSASDKTTVGYLREEHAELILKWNEQRMKEIKEMLGCEIDDE